MLNFFHAIRRVKEVIITKTKDIKSAKRSSRKYLLQSEAEPSATTTTTTTTTATTVTTTTSKSKKSRHTTTDEEKSILTPYLTNPNPSDEKTERVLESLLKPSTGYWTKKKIKAAWRYVQNKKKS
ncbi:hypothetical protein RclHR1_10450009 [Rhizophagus clarus]|uniref:Uncharacterized protein n=1 Tax=Rhizophagus clarus TaxID=94130 RepID=A0A2Z6QU14_9GLOM|nr:hypothetical protein RclHR1_10450009 [Rhizophagus clarus]